MYGDVCYRLPNFSRARAPCSSHSCFVIHMFSLSAICGVAVSCMLCTGKDLKLGAKKKALDYL